MNRLLQRPLLLVFLAAFLLRLIAAVAVEQHVQAAGRRFLIEGDANGYWELGVRLASGQSYANPPRRVTRTPGFPLLLAPIIAICGDHVLPARCVLACIGALCCPALAYLASAAGCSRRTAILVAALMAISPLQVGTSVLILTETWFTLWLIISLWLLLMVVNQLRLSGRDAATGTYDDIRFREFRLPQPVVFPIGVAAMLTGVAVGFATLIRPSWLPWIAPCVALTAVRSGIRWRTPGLTAAMLIGLAAVMFPWALRNHAVTGHWVITSLWSGPSLYDGLHPTATGASDMQFVEDDGLYGQLSEYEANREYNRRAIEYLKTHPSHAASLAVAKTLRFLSLTPNADELSNPLLRVACFAWYLPFFLMAIFGFCTARATWDVRAILAGSFVQFLLLHMVFVGSIRYRLPVEFPLAVFVAFGIESGLRMWAWHQALASCEGGDAPAP